MKCHYCNEKAEITVKKTCKEKVPYCRFHWKMLCLQEAVKFFKMNQISIEEIGRLLDKNVKLADFFEHLTKH
jgi:hypothetical protein